MKTPLLAGVAAGAVLAGCTANAADLNFYKAPPAAAPLPVLSWTGCYIGAHIGAGWGHDDLAGAGASYANSTTRTVTIVPTTVTTTGSAPPATDLKSFYINTSGIFGGGQGGCDYQIAPNWLIGIEGEGAGADIHGSAVDPFFPEGPSVPGRIGSQASRGASGGSGTAGCSTPRGASPGWTTNTTFTVRRPAGPAGRPALGSSTRSGRVGRPSSNTTSMASARMTSRSNARPPAAEGARRAFP